MFGFTGPEYYPLYLLVMFVLISIKSASNNALNLNINKNSMIGCIVLSVFFILFFSGRPLNNYFPDSHGYAAYYEYICRGGTYKSAKNELSFSYLTQICANFGLSVKGYFGVITLLYLFPIIWTCRLLFKGNEYLGFICCCVSFAFYSGAGAILRNGLGCSFAMLAIALWLEGNNKQKILSVIIGVIAFYFHHSVIIMIASFLISYYVVKKPSMAIIIWMASIVLSIAVGRSLGVMASSFFEDQRLNSYVNTGLEENNFTGFSHSGFRWDFLIYSSSGVLMIWYVTIYRRVKDKIYQMIANTYIIANSIWIILIYALFSDRFARLSWVILPFILIYPMIRLKIWENGRFMIGLILYGQWLFLTILYLL